MALVARPITAVQNATTRITVNTMGSHRFLLLVVLTAFCSRALSQRSTASFFHIGPIARTMSGSGKPMWGIFCQKPDRLGRNSRHVGDFRYTYKMVTQA